MCFVPAINAGHHAPGLPPPLPMRRHATGPLGGKKLTVDKRYYRAADQMLDPGWRAAHLAALSTPTAPGNGASTELTVNAGRLVAERANRDEEIALMLERTSLARNTHHGYRLQLASFLAWCHENDVTPLPADAN